MRFSEFLKINKITQETVAKDLNTSQATVSRWVRGDFIPRNNVMQKIIAYTNGEVQPNDFYDAKNA